MGQPSARISRSFVITTAFILFIIAAASAFYGIDYFVPLAESRNSSESTDSATGNQTRQGKRWFKAQIEYVVTAREVLEQMQYRHYRQMQLTEKQSAEFTNHLLNQLDPTRAFLLAEDVDGIRRRERQLTSAFLVGRLDPLFEVYNLYQQRMEERYTFLMNLLEKEHAKQDFTVKETLAVDREKAEWAKTSKELDEFWRLQHKSATLNLLLADKTPEEIPDILKDRYKRQISQLEKTRDEDVFVFFMNVLTTFYDPHSQYFSPRQYENFSIRMNLSLQGIGVILKAEGDYATVQRVIPGGPADLSRQLRAGDRIVAAGEGATGEFVNVIGWRLDDVVGLIRGEAGSTVRLQIQPFDSVNQRQYRVVTLERNEVRLEEQAAQKKLLEIDVGDVPFKLGIVKVPTFYVNFDDQRAGKKDYRSSTRDVQRLLSELEADGAQGMVIDLRDNGGGSLEEAISLTGLFVPGGGPVLQVREADNRIGTMTTRPASYQYRKPVVVIVNRLSASASEIFAAALQDYRRAIIVGERTYGKGTVQRIIMLNNGQLKYTSALFYRINGETTQHQGVMPDIVFPSFIDHATVGESALDNALPADRIRALRFPPSPINLPPVPWLIEKHLERNLLDADYVHHYKTVRWVTEQRENPEISLVLSERKAESDHDQALRLQFENERRARKNLPALETADDLKTEEDIDEQILEREYNRSIEDSDEKPDVILRASARILAEMIRYEYEAESARTVKQ